MVPGGDKVRRNQGLDANLVVNPVGDARRVARLTREASLSASLSSGAGAGDARHGHSNTFSPFVT
jgi:hypothetical protein